MYLYECLNNERTKNCEIIANPNIPIYMDFNTSLENVAMITDDATNEIILLSKDKCYIMDNFIVEPTIHENDFNILVKIKSKII